MAEGEAEVEGIVQPQPSSISGLAVRRAATRSCSASLVGSVRLCVERLHTASSQPSGGLHTLFSIVMAGLVGSTPHMVSAAVLALARLLFEFAPRLQSTAPALLPAVLMLLRTKSRETVKAVLGFIKVCTMRMPAVILSAQLGPILEGVLLWGDDSKNKFKLKVRVIVERLARRCGYESVAAHMPPSEAKLLAHIRKAAARKERRRAGPRTGGASQADGSVYDDEEEGDEDGAASARASSRGGAKTARGSEWGHTAIFSDAGGSQAGGDTQGRKATRVARSEAGRSSGGAGAAAAAGGGARLSEGAGGGEPMDLLEPNTSRKLVKTAAGVRIAPREAPGGGGGADPVFGSSEGKMVVEDEDPFAWQKRKSKRKRIGEEGYDSDDSDMEDLKGFAGLKLAMKSAGNARSVRFAASQSGGSQGGKTAGGKTAGGRTAGGRSAASGKTGASGRSGVSARSAASGKSVASSAHSGDRFKPKRQATGGDMAGRGSKTEPYAYWPLDRKMLNRRKGKHASASEGLGKVVTSSVVAGAMRGAKTRRQGGRQRQGRPEGDGGVGKKGAWGGRGGGDAYWAGWMEGETGGSSMGAAEWD
ncbi:MAG: hypothetical protein WDW36_006538 [Sanguina aurantia]